MTTDHLDIAEQAFILSALPPPPRLPDEALRYLTRLLGLLPAEEQAGYLGKPGGDNIAALPDGTFVSVSRICYPDGQLYKVMSDAPNGGPQWVDNGLVPAGQRYIPFGGPHTMPAPDDPPPPTVDLTARVVALEVAVIALRALFEEQLRQLGNVNLLQRDFGERLVALENKPPPAPPRPWWQF
jgi:hypothetical protein